MMIGIAMGILVALCLMGYTFEKVLTRIARALEAIAERDPKP